MRGLYLFIVTAIQLTILFSGCFEQTIYNRFIGTWRTENGGRVVFYSDGNCDFFNSKGKWELKDDLVLITVPFPGGENIFGWEYNFTSDYKILTLINARGDVYILHRQ